MGVEQKMHRCKHYQLKKGDTVAATVRPKVFSMHHTTCCYEGDADFNVMNKTDAACLLTMKGGLIKERNLHFSKGDEGEEEIAKSHEAHFNLGGLVGADEYSIEVEPGNDVTLILASLLVFDEIE